MTKTIAEATSYIDELVVEELPDAVRAFVLPALTSLAAVRDRLPADTAILLGAQNAHYEAEGPHTGEVSMRMVREAGATIVEIGHSERRANFAESNEVVAAKVRAAVDHDLIPLICIGESRAVRDGGDASGFVRRQLDSALAGLDQAEWDGVLLAYEPVWAIGESGTPATPEQIAPVLEALFDASNGRPSILYGGNVDAVIADELRGLAHLDGLFVGRSAWTAGGLRRLIEVWARPAHTTGHPSTRIPESVC